MDHLNYLDDFVALGPHIGFELGEDEHAIDVNFECAEAGVEYKLLLFLIEIFVFSH